MCQVGLLTFPPFHKSWTKFWSLESILSIGRRTIFNNLQSTSDLIQLHWCLGPSKWKCLPILETRSHFIYFEAWDPILFSTPYLWGMKVCLWTPACCQWTILTQRFLGLPEWISACHLLRDSPSPCSACFTPLISSWSSDNVEFYPSPVVLENWELQNLLTLWIPRNGKERSFPIQLSWDSWMLLFICGKAWRTSCKCPLFAS